MAITSKSKQNNYLQEAGFQEEKSKILVVGPYASNYSFAKVNRGIALGLSHISSNYQVKVWKEPTVGLDYKPSAADLEKLPELAELLTNEVADVDITIFNSFTPDSEIYGLAALPGRIKLMYMAWEESVFPASRVIEMNQNLHGVMAASSFTKEILQKNGVKVPVEVVPNALDDSFLEAKLASYPLKTSKKVKFLHISSARIRKGVDVLLKAYFNSFTSEDDVVLVIKSFPGPDNTVNDLLGRLRKEYKNAPEVLHIFDPNLTEQELINLTGTATATVYPTRAEGFGLPIAESMYLQVPTIVTGYSGHMDFCNSENSFLLDYEITDATDSEMVNIGAKWAEPSIVDLEKKMRYVYENYESDQLKEIGNQAHESTKHLNWDTSAKTALEFVGQIEQIQALKNKKVAVITEINSIGGIAEYSKDLYDSVQHSFSEFYFIGNTDATDRTRPDEPNVLRLWENGSQDFSEVVSFLKKEQINHVHIQHHSAYISMTALGSLITQIDALKDDLEIEILLTPHDALSKGSNFKQIKSELALVDHIFAHKQADYELFKKLGVIEDKLTLFPLPFDTYPIWPKKRLQTQLKLDSAKPVIVTHGIFSFHKGLLQTAEAIKLLQEDYPDILWLAVNAISPNNISSSDTYDQVRSKIKELDLLDNVRFFTDFLDAMEVMALLESADLGLLVYDEVGESASAAVRKFLASGTPTIVTDIPMMTELTHKQEVFKISDNRPEAIATGVKELLQEQDLANKISLQALQTSKSQSWEAMALRMLKDY